MTMKGPFERHSAFPAPTGLYNAAYERDACGLAMVATLRGTPGHDIVDGALRALRNLEHRGAVGSDAGTGDGAGIITQIPDRFFREEVSFELPEKGRYAVGIAFLSADSAERIAEKRSVEGIAREEGLEVLGWRVVPTREEEIGDLARETMPGFEQLFVRSHSRGENGPGLGGIALDLSLIHI